MRIARYFIFLSLIIWLGGIIFFSAVVAPSVFGVLSPVEGGRHLAGDIVNRSLGALHWMGIVCGIVFVVSSSYLNKRFGMMANYLVLAMILLTAVSQFGITPRMAAIRASGEIGGADFARLHQLSTITEAAVLLLGLGVVALVAKRME